MLDKDFEELEKKFKPMIFHVMKRLNIYQNKDEFYQIGCIALWEAALRFDKNKGKFSSFAYSYIAGRMKTELTKQGLQKKYHDLVREIVDCREDYLEDFSFLYTHSIIESLSPLLTYNQLKWLKGYCLYEKAPTEIAKEESTSVVAVKAWRRDALKKLRSHQIKERLK